VTRTSGDDSVLYLVTGMYTINAAYQGFRIGHQRRDASGSATRTSRHHDRLDSEVLRHTGHLTWVCRSEGAQVHRAHGRRTAGIALGMFLAYCSCAFALNPALDVSQYAHTAWKVSDGFFKGIIFAIAQTPDG
jgi:hypothetical protein